jgi:hypothetical protein
MSKTSSSSAIYDEWLLDCAFIAALLVVILSIHALTVAQVRVLSGVSATGKVLSIPWHVVLQVGLALLLAYVALGFASNFLDDTVSKFKLDQEMAENGKLLLRYWIYSTWGLVVFHWAWTQAAIRLSH